MATSPSGGLERIGAAFGVLMTRLGYPRYVAQGGDWGAGAATTVQLPPHY